MTRFKILCLAATAGITLPTATMADGDVLLRMLTHGLYGGTVYHVIRDDDDRHYRGHYRRGDHGYYRHGGRHYEDRGRRHHRHDRDDDDDDD